MNWKSQSALADTQPVRLTPADLAPSIHIHIIMRHVSSGDKQTSTTYLTFIHSFNFPPIHSFNSCIDLFIYLSTRQHKNGKKQRDG